MNNKGESQHSSQLARNIYDINFLEIYQHRAWDKALRKLEDQIPNSSSSLVSPSTGNDNNNSSAAFSKTTGRFHKSILLNNLANIQSISSSAADIDFDAIQSPGFNNNN